MLFEILTPTGFKSFKGVGRYWHEKVIRFSFVDNTSLVTALKHIFIVNGEERFADSLCCGEEIGKKIILIEIVYEPQYLYDPLNVDDGSIYTHDNLLVSHNSFVGTSNTLLASEHLLKLKARSPIQTRGSLKIYHKFDESHQYAMFVDVSKGRGQDYSTFSVIDITARPFLQVATYRDNKISPLLFPDIIVNIAKHFGNALVVIENNDAGQVVCNAVYYEYEYENTFLESAVKSGGIGVTMTKRVKRIGCSNLKDLIEMDKLILTDAETMTELSTFEANGSSYEASSGNHDDMVMNMVLFAWFVSTDAFGNNLENFSLKDMLMEGINEQAYDDLPPFGFIDDGRSSTPSMDTYDKMVNDLKQWNSL